MSELQQNINSNAYGEVFNAIEAKQQQRLRVTKQREFEDKINLLADKALEYQSKDENLYLLLESFLEVAIEMKKLMDSMNAINVAMEAISDAVGFLDAALDFDSVFMDQSLQNNYGFFARMKLKHKYHKTIKNNRGRMLAISKSLEMKYTMASDMMKALSNVSSGLKKSIEKSNKKMKKDVGGKSEGNSAAKSYLEQRKKELGGEFEDTSSAPTTPSSSGSVSDISDIL